MCCKHNIGDGCEILSTWLCCVNQSIQDSESLKIFSHLQSSGLKMNILKSSFRAGTISFKDDAESCPGEVPAIFAFMHYYYICKYFRIPRIINSCFHQHLTNVNTFSHLRLGRLVARSMVDWRQASCNPFPHNLILHHLILQHIQEPLTV